MFKQRSISEYTTVFERDAGVGDDDALCAQKHGACHVGFQTKHRTSALYVIKIRQRIGQPSR